MHVDAEAMTIQAATSVSLSRLLPGIYSHLTDNRNNGHISAASGVGHFRVPPPNTRISRAASNAGSVALARTRGLTVASARRVFSSSPACDKRGALDV